MTYMMGPIHLTLIFHLMAQVRQVLLAALTHTPLHFFFQVETTKFSFQLFACLQSIFVNILIDILFF